MPIPTIPLWGQIISNGINNIRDVLRTAKERYNSMSPEQKAEAARVGDQWVRDNVLPTVTTLGEILPQTSIPMAAYVASEAKTPEEKFQHIMMPIMMGSVGKGTNLALKASEKAIDTAGKALKNADSYVTIQNALRTGKLKFGEPTTYTGIHQSKTPLTKVQFPFQRWDVTTHGADPNGFWLTLADSPNTTGTMASRPYASRWSATSQKPLIQTGEVKGLLGKKNNTRNAIVKYGRKHGADAFEFRGIRDNAIPQTDVVMVTEGTNPQYLGEFTEHTYVSPKTSYKSLFMEEPIMGRGPGRPKKSSTEVPISPEAWDEMLFEDLIGEQGAIKEARKASWAGKRVLKPITEAEKLGIPKSLRDKVNPTNYLQSQGFGLPRKHLQGNDAVKMFKEYGTVEIPENSQLIDQLRKYIPEVRERYGLVGNTNITDDEIIGSLYKRVSENSDLPIVGFRGDTKRYNKLIPQSIKVGDSPDNILGRMTLDDISETNRYLYTYAPDLFFDGGYKFTPPYRSIGAENALGIGRKSNLQIVDTWSRYGESAPVFKVPAEKTPTGVNDINAFIFKPKTKIVDFDPTRTSDGAIDIDYANQILGKLDGNSIIRIKKAPTLEHDANYYIIPNNNLLSAKHLLPFDFRIAPQWNSRIIYRKQGGKIKGIVKAQEGVPEIDGGELDPVVVKPKPVRIILRTDPITKNTPITHSSLTVPSVSKKDLGFFISKGSDDATYNLFTANCSDATGKCLQDITGVDFTSGITTPIGVSRKARSVFGNQSGYTESGGGLFKSRIQSFEVPWYDYRKAKDLYKERLLNSLIKKWRTDGIKWSKERENALRKNWWEQNPKLKYYLDENNNVIKNPQQ